MTLDQQIEAVLFYKGEPVKIKKLSALLEKEEGEIKNSLDVLNERLKGGLRLVFNGDEVMLGTAPELSSLITNITKEELNKDLGKAGLETLSIILYKGEISKKDLDYLRGVNSSFILRNLSIRGLVEKFDKNGIRSSFYKPTMELLSMLGLSKVEDLPEYQKVMEDMQKLNEQKEKEESETQNS